MNKVRIVSLIMILSWCIVFSVAQEASSEVVVTLERAACRGTCPVYSVNILDDGTINYEGENFVEISGTQNSQIDPETVQLMIEAFEDAGYFDWNDEYTTQNVTDLPTVTTSVTQDGTIHQIVRYAGDFSAPFMLPYLEQWIDEMANTQQWTGIPSAIANIPTMELPALIIEHGECYGTCPVYKLAIYGDGTAVYMGIANVEDIGVYLLEVEPTAVIQIAEIAEIIGFSEWSDRYDSVFKTDQSTTITTIQTPDWTKSISRYGGDPNAPVGLIWIEDSIDQLLSQ